MPQIVDFGGRRVDRCVTVAALRAAKGSGRHLAQVTADTAEEAAAAEAAGIELVLCRAAHVARVREGSSRVFVTAALGFAEAITADELLRTAFQAVTSGADAVITGRGWDVVRLLAAEQIPVGGLPPTNWPSCRRARSRPRGRRTPPAGRGASWPPPR